MQSLFANHCCTEGLQGNMVRLAEPVESWHNAVEFSYTLPHAKLDSELSRLAVQRDLTSMPPTLTVLEPNQQVCRAVERLWTGAEGAAPGPRASDLAAAKLWVRWAVNTARMLHDKGMPWAIHCSNDPELLEHPHVQPSCRTAG